jgi:hypothetical protein
VVFIAFAFALYLVYVPFQDWSYLRFLLPAVVVMIVLASATTSAIARRLPGALHVVVVVAIAGALSTSWVKFAKVHYAFDLQASEQRFVETAQWVDRHVPPGATVFASWHSGSIRYYGQRLSVVWDAIQPDQLDSAIDYLQRIGRPAYAVFEPWELDAFRERFGGRSTFGALDWPPRAQIGTQVQFFDFADRPRYFAGQPVPTERVWTTGELRALRRR